MLTIDPVCNTEIQSDDTKYITHYKGRTYYFESRQCQEMFENDPDAYAEIIPERVYDDHGDRIDGSE